MIMPIRYVCKRYYSIDYMGPDWLRLLKKSPAFFKVSSLTVDFSRNEEMEIFKYLSKEVWDQSLNSYDIDDEVFLLSVHGSLAHWSLQTFRRQ